MHGSIKPHVLAPRTVLILRAGKIEQRSAGTPTGQISFVDTTTATSIGTVNITADSASVTYTLPTGGTHSIMANYLGGTDFSPGSSPPGPLTVSKAVPTITWTPGSITQGAALSGAQLNASATGVTAAALPGSFTYSPAPGTILPTGPNTLQATFVPTDTTDYTSPITTRTLAVPPAATTTIVSSTLNPSTYNNSVSLIATVAEVGPVAAGQTPPSGTVTFFDGPTQIGSAQTLVNGSASIATSTLTGGSHSIKAVFASLNDYFTGSTSNLYTQTVSSATPVITWNPTTPTIVYGTVLSAAQLNATANVPGSFSYSPAAGATLGAGNDNVTATFTPTDTTSYAQATKSATITVTPFTPVVTWTTPAAIPYGTPLSFTQLNATAVDAHGVAIPGTFSYSPGPGTVLPVGSQQLSLSFIPTDTTDFTSTGGLGVHVTQLVNQDTTTTSLAITPNTPGYGQTITLTATSSATPATPLTGGVIFTTYPGNITVGSASFTGNTATTTASTLNPAFAQGSNTIVATLVATTNYASSTGQQSFTLGKGSPTFTWTPGSSTMTYGTALTAAQLNATSTVPGSIAYSFIPAGKASILVTPGTILPAGSDLITATFTPTETTNYQTTTTQATFLVTQFTPNIVWPSPSSITTSTPLSATQLDATATGVGGITLPGTFTYTPTAGSLLSPGIQTLNVSFVPTDTIDYASTTGSTHLSVLNLATLTTLTSSIIGTAPIEFGQPNTFTATITRVAASDNPITGTVTFYDSSVQLGTPQPVTTTAQGTTATYLVSTIAAGSHSYTATYSGDTNNATSTSTPALLQTVTASPTTLAWTPLPATIPYGTPLSAAQLDAVPTSPYAGTPAGLIAYTPTLGTILSAGPQILSATFTPTTPGNFNASAGQATITVTQATPTLTWTPPVSITQGTPLSAAQLDAVATGITGAALPGTFTYAPAAGVILPSGPNILSVTFTPTDAVDYTSKTLTVPIAVNIPAATITLSSPTNPTQYGQSATLTATVAPGGTLTAAPTGNVSFYDSGKLLGTQPLVAGIATLPIATLATGPHTITATYAGDAANAASTSTNFSQTVTQATSVVTFAPNPSSIVYGTALTAAQLDATVTSAYIATVPGTFAYTPALGTVPGAGTTTLSVTFTPTDTVNFSTVTRTAALTVTRATPTVVFPTPASVIAGTPLSTTQLDATATGVTNATLPGTFTYTPPAGTLVTGGNQTLSVLFTPTDLTDYTTQTATTTLNGVAVTLTSLSVSTAAVGDTAKTITLTGTGFAPDAIAQSNGLPLATTFVNSTTLQAVLPATSFTAVTTLQITVSDPTQKQTSAALPFSVTTAVVNATVPPSTTTSPGDQPSLSYTFTNSSQSVLTGTLTLTFTSPSGVNDPSIQFSTGGRTFNFTVQPGQQYNPTILLQAGTVTGVITITVDLKIGTADVTPAGLQPTQITVQAVVPSLSAVILAASGNTLTVSVTGFSNTLAVQTATFHFTPIAGQTLQTTDITLDVSSLFSAYFSSAFPATYGSEFVYTQSFTLNEDASIIGQVTVTLSNAQGVSLAGSSQ
jgi:hypothetical protein